MSLEDVVRLQVGARQILLVGTAHISRASADLVREVIEAERPDCVCIELDQARYDQMRQEKRFESLDLKQVLRQQQLAPLLLNLVLISYQQQLGGQLGVTPGAEFHEAAAAAQSLGIPIVLCDRDIKTTLKRAWGALSLRKRLELFGSVIVSAFNRPKLSEEDLQKLREQDVATRLIRELGETLPGLTRVLIDERDAYLAEKIRRSEGQKVVAVVGAGHVDGMRRALEENQAVDLTQLEVTPPTSKGWHWFAWSMPIAIIGALVTIGLRKGAAVAGDSVLFWILITGVPSMIGTLLAGAHPFTALSAMLSAPITTLSPVLGVGYVAAAVEAYMRPPRVHELRSVTQDASFARRWWKNRLLRILLIFVFSSIGGSLGMFAGSAGILRGLFG